jgi:flagellar hook-basal body complex protein FliE
MISSNIAGTAAYAAIQGGDATGSTESKSQSFGSALTGALNNMVDLGHTADAKSIEAMGGHGNLTDVVMAVSKAEMALQTSVAVRDRVISAYQEIMRMSV